MKVQTKQTQNGWCVLVDGIVKYSNLTMHEAEQIATNLRIDIKRGVAI